MDFQIGSQDLATFADEMSKVYGPVFTLFLPLPTVMLTDFKSIDEALRKKGGYYCLCFGLALWRTP